MIPPFDEGTGNLPPGVHPAMWDEITERFGFSERRRRLLAKLALAIEYLSLVGCRRIYIDGSFVSSKKDPGDYDACYDPVGVNMAMMRQLFPSLVPYNMVERASQWAEYGGDIFPALALADNSYRFLDFFQRDKQSRAAKGIVALEIGGEP